MEIHRSFKNGGNWSLKEGKIGLTGKDGKTSLGRVLFTVRRSRVSSKGIPLPSLLLTVGLSAAVAFTTKSLLKFVCKMDRCCPQFSSTALCFV